MLVTSYLAYGFISRMPTTPPSVDEVESLDSLCVQSGEHAKVLDGFLLHASYREDGRDDESTD